MVEYIDIFNGGSAMVLLVMGISFGIYYFIQYGKTKKKMLPLVAIVFILLGIFYLGPVTSFIALQLTGNNISGELYGYLSYSLSPVTTPIALVLGFWIFKTEWRFKILWFFVPLALLYWFFLLVMPFFGVPAFEYSEVPGRLLDVSHSGACLYLAAVYILAVVVMLGGGFFILSSRIRGTPEFKKALFLGIGWLLFGIAGVMDALLSDSFPNIIFLARGLMIFSFIFIFTGFLPSKQTT